MIDKNSIEKAINKHKKVKIFGISFTYKSKEWKEIANKINIAYNESNLIKEKGTGSKNILFVTDMLLNKGGVETRLQQYINYISENDWNCYILTEKNENEQLNKTTNFTLNFDFPNVQKCLEEIIDKFNIDIIEFQFKNPKVLKNIKLKKLKKKARVGCTIHDISVKKLKVMQEFDYKIIVSKFLHKRHYTELKDAIIIQNGINGINSQNISWKYTGQKNAIFISRISKGKLKSIEGFIKFCQKNNIKFLIAGEEHNKNTIKEKLIKDFNIEENTFIGEINTIEYLSQNINNILFVGGVGLVILEALSLNYPCLCCSDFEENNFSFITENNISLFENFTINNESLVTQKNKKEYDFDLNNLHKYQLKEYIIENRNITKYTKQYLSLLEKL